VKCPRIILALCGVVPFLLIQGNAKSVHERTPVGLNENYSLAYYYQHGNIHQGRWILHRVASNGANDIAVKSLRSRRLKDYMSHLSHGSEIELITEYKGSNSDKEAGLMALRRLCRSHRIVFLIEYLKVR
jgi:hypothetical protein